MHAEVIVLAGPSGAGKSRLAERMGLPVLRLDDFYKSAGDPTLPLITTGANAGLVDWDHPDSWHPDDAVAAVRALCETGHAEVPIYDIAHDGRCGWQSLHLGDHPLYVAEGIFAQEIVPRLREEGWLAAAYCVRQHPAVTFWRRLNRDLREHRKPPLVLLTRGLGLARAQRGVVADAVAKGCTPASPDEVVAAVEGLGSEALR
ncbi:MAG: ATP-binding protein [Nocardioides sp.]|jgi:uridine kinase